MTTEEGNKLIAEFMGNAFSAEWYLKYHTSWDWLMPVVEKIEQDNSVSIDIFPHRIFVNKGANYVSEYQKGYNFHRGTNEKIKTLWLAVVEFIKWHNP